MAAFTAPLRRLVAAAATLACAATASATAEGYLGLDLRDLPDGSCVVSWIHRGPLGGDGITSSTLCRPDVVVSLDGAPVESADAFAEAVRALEPGTDVVLAYHPHPKRSGRFPREADRSLPVQSVRVIVDDAARWRGTIGLPRRDGAPAPASVAGPRSLAVEDSTSVLGAAVGAHELDVPIAALRAALRDRAATETDHHQLALVLGAFEDPFALPELAAAAVAPAQQARDNPVAAIAGLATRNLDLAPREIAPLTVPVPHAHSGLFLLDFYMNETRLALRNAIGPRMDDPDFAEQCLDLLSVPRREFYVAGNDDERVLRCLAAVQASITVDFEALGAILVHLAADHEIQFDPAAVPAMPLPEELAGAVEGDVLAADAVPELGWLVVGGPGPNRYDMSRVAGVLELGGDDRYDWPSTVLRSRTIIDHAGDDTYVSEAEATGPGGALLGVSFIDDRAGNDLYRGRRLSLGAAMYGVGLIVDRAGDDRYRAEDWSQGAAVYGVGAIVDLDGHDDYEVDFLGQGVGGPRGLGVIVDARGRDRYDADGAQPSMYDSPAVSASFSQGVGFGFRNTAAGGVGALVDLQGNDRYVCGEFGQAGAYYHGFGILHDAGGRDLYHGNRYAQGWGAHEGFGVLLEDAGDDTYWAMTAASQGAGWDLSAGALVDRAGDDSYQADGLAQGAAAQQALGLLLDLDGSDRYAAAGDAIQGTSGRNEYHYDTTGAFSFSLLLDLGNKPDVRSSGRGDDVIVITGALDEEDPAASPLSGLLIDR